MAFCSLNQNGFSRNTTSLNSVGNMHAVAWGTPQSRQQKKFRIDFIIIVIIYLFSGCYTHSRTIWPTFLFHFRSTCASRAVRCSVCLRAHSCRRNGDDDPSHVNLFHIYLKANTKTHISLSLTLSRSLM